MLKKTLTILLSIPLMYLLCPAFADQPPKTIDYENIFSLKHNQVSIPKGDTLFIYVHSRTGWRVADTLRLPERYLALDGNIRRIYILMDDAMLFYGFYGESNDTLYFNEQIQRPATNHWIRTPYSTEKDFTVYNNGQEMSYVNDGDEWFAFDVSAHANEAPGMRRLVDAKKCYHYQDHSGEYTAAVGEDRITFHRLPIPNDKDLEAIQIYFEEQLETDYPSPEELTFDMDPDAITAFIYDQRNIAVVFADKIQFFFYSFADQKWIPNQWVPDFHIRNAT